MKNRSDAADEQDALQQKLAGLGEYSLRKTYYPELQERLAELDQSERFLKNIVDNIPAIVFAKEAKELRYVIFNKAAEELLGYKRDGVLGRNDFDIFPAEQAAAFVQRDREVLARGKLVEIREETVKTSRGNDLILYTKKIPLFDDSGVAQYLLGISEDITERKQLEGQLLQSQKMEAIGRLAGGIAHDFNNILMVIMGYADVLQRGEGLAPPQLESVRKIASASEKAAQLTGNLLTFSRKQVMKTRIANVKEIVQHIQEFVGRIIGEDIQLRTIFTPHDLLVDVDSGQIEQVLLNLATNARDAMPKGGVLTIETGMQEVDAALLRSINWAAPGRYACIAVSDTGVGMDEKTRQKIFEPFFTTKEPGKGTGLGMAIVYGILKQHKGFVNIYSEPGIGTTFKLYLPLATLATDVELPVAIQPMPRGGTETILVAEDEADVRALVEEILTGHGYRVLTAINGLDAVEKYAAHRGDIKLVLMDMIMPRLSGKDACVRIQQQDPAARVLFISGYTMDFVLNSDLLDERTELVMKPVQPLELLRKVREMLDG
ncbi:blue-light-activated protein [Geobacter sp. OR-1]|uniref:ATP-binding protein n=1 Tax=Geobacter sp. OR-1 TaxID=1266765 RepID=UPI000543E06C|nr:ATP-binding protein [Geobacter sp. OR-1]GAM11464.1 blue-light-activated protein [Geobacter sp. OR-1]